MNRKKEGVKTITFDIGGSLKDKLDLYCKRRALTLAEALRCYVLNLPEDEGTPCTEAELSDMIKRLERKRDTLRAAHTSRTARQEPPQPQEEQTP